MSMSLHRASFFVRPVLAVCPCVLNDIAYVTGGFRSPYQKWQRAEKEQQSQNRQQHRPKTSTLISSVPFFKNVS